MPCSRAYNGALFPSILQMSLEEKTNFSREKIEGSGLDGNAQGR
jgi:hypothetical protein